MQETCFRFPVRVAAAAVAALALPCGAAAMDRPSSPLLFSVKPAGDGRSEFVWSVTNRSNEEFDLVVRAEGPWEGGDEAVSTP